MSKIIKEFHKDMTQEEFSHWVINEGRFGKQLSIHPLICHVETKFENMQAEIDELTREARRSKKEEHPEFKVGWVYEHSHNGMEYLVVGISGGLKNRQAYTINLSHFPYDITSWEYPRSLQFFKMETGKKWEPKE